MITADPADNSDTIGLITEGYALNEAFFFEVDRSSQRAHLQPSPALLAALRSIGAEEYVQQLFEARLVGGFVFHPLDLVFQLMKTADVEGSNKIL